YDVLLENTNPEFVKMEMDLGWVIVTGNDPLAYFAKYPGRFPLWHLKDMDLKEKHSVELGKGGLDVKKMLQNSKKAGMKYFFVEQEEYTGTAFDCLAYNIDYLKRLF
ncbi:MAG: sugar phosphate isomerase/epimerase, partial [Bacteroidota bacterium]|nr:sugar phosphate isomerase/epimerase [Bacteroidota bacterium]